MNSGVQRRQFLVDVVFFINAEIGVTHQGDYIFLTRAGSGHPRGERPAAAMRRQPLAVKTESGNGRLETKFIEIILIEAFLIIVGHAADLPAAFLSSFQLCFVR